LKFIYSIWRFCTLGPGVASHRTFLTEESRKLALPVPWQDFSTPPAHPWKMANKIAQIRKDFVDKPSNDSSKNHAVGSLRT